MRPGSPTISSSVTAPALAANMRSTSATTGSYLSARPPWPASGPPPRGGVRIRSARAARPGPSEGIAHGGTDEVVQDRQDPALRDLHAARRPPGRAGRPRRGRRDRCRPGSAATSALDLGLQVARRHEGQSHIPPRAFEPRRPERLARPEARAAPAARTRTGRGRPRRLAGEEREPAGGGRPRRSPPARVQPRPPRPRTHPSHGASPPPAGPLPRRGVGRDGCPRRGRDAREPGSVDAYRAHGRLGRDREPEEREEERHRFSATGAGARRSPGPRGRSRVRRTRSGRRGCTRGRGFVPPCRGGPGSRGRSDRE